MLLKKQSDSNYNRSRFDSETMSKDNKIPNFTGDLIGANNPLFEIPNNQINIPKKT